MAYRKVSDASLGAVADAIREKAGTSEVLVFPDGFTKAIAEIKATEEDQVYILVDESGNEVTAVLVDEQTVFDATANDIRLGKTAVTESGVTVGEKEIPAYITQEGRKRISPDKELSIPMYSDLCQYTRLQVIVCAYNTSIADSVAAEMVVINDALYDVLSTSEKASVTVDIENQSINLGITNDSGNYLVIRYFTYNCYLYSINHSHSYFLLTFHKNPLN